MINLEFQNLEQEIFFWSTYRNNCFSGGFGNGKTWVACARQFVMLKTFPGYISLFARKQYKELKTTTMKTFFKICPPDFVLRHDLQEGLTIFKNGSCALWVHLDAFDEQSLRGLEINSACVDQGEEIEEAIYFVLDARIGRWDGAKVPDKLLLQAVPKDILDKVPYSLDDVNINPKLASLKQKLLAKSTWPINPVTKKPRVRNFIDILVNPANKFHWVYRHYHPDSLERRKNHFYVERSTDDKLNDPDTIERMKDRDPEWVDRYYKGIWGNSAAQIHKLNPISIIDPDIYSKDLFDDFLKRILSRGALYRSLDHGDTSPTCCLWFCAINNIHICYREYYVPDQAISFHREAITELSKNEIYENDIADPSIFYKTRKSLSGRTNIKTSIADEYSSDEIEGPAIFWSPGDNNELATRNRINELLALTPKASHPISLVSPGPRLYFIKRTDSYPYGCFQALLQLQKQSRESIGSDNGRTIYSDDRDKNVIDHAYDPTRYYVAEHSMTKPLETKEPPERSFANFERIRRKKPVYISNY